MTSRVSRSVLRPLVAGVGLAVLATTAAGCVGQDQTKVGGGPANSPSAAPAHLRPTGSPAMI